MAYSVQCWFHSVLVSVCRKCGKMKYRFITCASTNRQYDCGLTPMDGCLGVHSSGNRYLFTLVTDVASKVSCIYSLSVPAMYGDFPIKTAGGLPAPYSLHYFSLNFFRPWVWNQFFSQRSWRIVEFVCFACPYSGVSQNSKSRGNHPGVNPVRSPSSSFHFF